MICRLLVAAVVWWYAFYAAVVYGGIWDSQATPTKNVEVVLGAGKPLKGTLTRDWQKSWVLTSDDGGEVRFIDYQAMLFAKPQETRGFAQFWRAILPATVVNAGVLAFCFSGFFRRRKGAGFNEA